MTAREEGLEELKGWKWLKKQATEKVKMLDRISRFNLDPRGIGGQLKAQREKAACAIEAFNTAFIVKKETLEAFHADRKRSGEAEKKGTRAWFIRQAVERVLIIDPTLDGDELYCEVNGILEDDPPNEFPGLYNESKLIRRTLRRMGYDIPAPIRTKDTF